MTGTQFAHQCIGAPSCDPPEPKRGERYGSDALCWLCGSTTGGVGWPRQPVFPATFTNVNLARVPTSDTVCQACVYLSTSAPWIEYAAQHPEMELKTAHPLSWRSYSHVFSAAGHECPSRARMRQILTSPPEPPFLIVVALSGQKHLLFRAQIGYSRDVFPVQLEEESVILRRADIEACLVAFESLLALGFSRDDIVSGRYHPASMQRAGLRAWREAEDRFRVWRNGSPALVKLAHQVAQRPEKESS